MKQTSCPAAHFYLVSGNQCLLMLKHQKASSRNIWRNMWGSIPTTKKLSLYNTNSQHTTSARLARTNMCMASWFKVTEVVKTEDCARQQSDNNVQRGAVGKFFMSKQKYVTKTLKATSLMYKGGKYKIILPLNSHDNNIKREGGDRCGSLFSTASLRYKVPKNKA